MGGGEGVKIRRAGEAEMQRELVWVGYGVLIRPLV